MNYAFLFWISLIAMFLAGLGMELLGSRLRREILRSGHTPPAKDAKGKFYVSELARSHKSIFPVSRMRTLYHVSRGIQLLAALTGFIAITVSQFQPNNMLHLLPLGR